MLQANEFLRSIEAGVFSLQKVSTRVSHTLCHEKMHSFYQRHNCNHQVFCWLCSQNSFWSCFRQVFHHVRKWEKFPNESVWQELDKTHTHIAGFSGRSLRKIHVVVAWKLFCVHLSPGSSWLIEVTAMVQRKGIQNRVLSKFPGLRAE